jgi:flavin-dependent dehydrogenase
MTAGDSFTFVEAVENGWWYSAPIPDGRIVRMFVTESGGSAAAVQSSRRVDASSMRLDRVTGDGWLAVGDAATALDPLSSHGLGNALAQAIEAASAIVSGSFARYERMVDTMWESYVRVRHATYALEQRWPHSPFWLTNQHHVQRVDDARDHSLRSVPAPGVIDDHPFAEPGELLRGVRT